MEHQAPTPGDVELAFAYHERTKHQLRRHARSLGYLDWANQPDPFRRYPGAPLIRLARTEPQALPRLDELYSPGAIPPAELNFDGLSQLLFDTFAISAWKRSGGSRWSLRCNPSSGNLHPTEAYVLIPALPGLSPQPALHHYTAFEHGLECRLTLDEGEWQSLIAGLPPGSFFVGLSSIHWREAWKYGERAYRYCQHDIGHAITQLAYAGAALGWQVTGLEGPDDAMIATLLGIQHQQGPEAEHPDTLLLVSPIRPADALGSQWTPPPELLHVLAERPGQGEPNQLSPDHIHWEVIDQVALACRRAGPAPTDLHRAQPLFEYEPPRREVPARLVFRSRRSAVDMDGHSRMGLDDFVRILIRLLPTPTLPWATQTWRPLIHPLLFVHRVDGLAPGVYLLCRDSERLKELQTSLTRFPFNQVAALPPTLPLYLLIEGDVRDFARLANCHQNIAADGVFAVAMLAEFERPIRELGAWVYRRLFWEAGMLGQVLYLEAEAAGLRGTGIGCFFDDEIHAAVRLADRRFQSLYGFTIGGPLEDPRLQTEPAYFHLRDKL